MSKTAELIFSAAAAALVFFESPMKMAMTLSPS